jgi:hypothetical protein
LLRNDNRGDLAGYIDSYRAFPARASATHEVNFSLRTVARSTGGQSYTCDLASSNGCLANSA